MEVLHYGIYLSILLIVTSPCDCLVNPGLKLRITQKALNYASSQAIHSLNLAGKTIPDQHGSDDVSVGKVDYDITGARVSSFTAPQSQMTVASGQGIQWNVNGCGLQLNGDWKYHYKLGFISIKDSGSFDMSVENAHIQINIMLGRDTTGHPSIKSTGCSSGVDKVEVKIHGGTSWLYNIFDDNIDHAVRDQLQDILCDEANKAVNNDAEKALSKLKLVTPIEGTGILDYQLIVAPIFGNGYIDTNHKGEIYSSTSHKEAPFSAAPFPSSFSNNKMVYIWISDYVLNTAGYVVQNQGTLKYFLQPSNLPPKSRFMLNTTCPNQVCIGNFLYTVKHKYPGCTMSVNMSTTVAPTLLISQKQLIGRFEGDIQYFITFPNGTRIFGFETHVKANMSLAIFVNGTKLNAKVVKVIPTVNVTRSNIGKVSSAALNWSFQNLLTPELLIPKLNEIGAKGLELPSTNQVNFTNPEIMLTEDSIMLSTDLVWNPQLGKGMSKLFDKTLRYTENTLHKLNLNMLDG